MKGRLVSSLTTEGYQDIRYEKLQGISIEYQGEKLTDLSVNQKEGGHVRCFYNGGWGHFSFNELKGLEEALELAINSARVASKHQQEIYELAKAPVIEDKIVLTPEMDPRTIPLEEKRELISRYNKLILDQTGVTTTRASYYEQASHKYFANNQGTFIDQEELICGLRLQILVKGETGTQKVSLSLGGTHCFAELLEQEGQIIESVEKALALVTAEPVKAGNYQVILDPGAAGVFIHEAFGHLSEADGIADSLKLRETMKLGRVFGKPILNVLDDGSLQGHPGSIYYDDDGVPAQKTYLIKQGVLVGRLHSRETAGKMGEEVSGNSRARDFSFPPVVRMSNIFIDQGQTSFLEMVTSIKDGLYLVGAAGGQTSGNTFTLAVQYGYRIKDGKVGEMVRDIVINCNLFETMSQISAIGDDLTFSRAGGCGKAGQILLTSGMGAPHIKIDNITIGGQ